MWGLVLGLTAQPWVWRLGLVLLAALTIALFLLNLRQAGERAGRAAERLKQLETSHFTQRRMLEAASRRPADRDDLVERLRRGSSERVAGVCPQVVEYTVVEQARAAEEVEALQPTGP